MRIIVSGQAGLHPVGGMAWHYFQYVVGLARLGHDVYYHEDTWSWPYQPVEKTHTNVADYSSQFIQGFFDVYAPELGDRWHYLHLHEISCGMTRKAFDEVARTADLFLNVSGDCIFPDALSPRCRKVFIDTDPGYNQILYSERFDWSEGVERWRQNVADHDQHFTFGELIHRPECHIPTVEFEWTPTRMPIVMDLWASPDPHTPDPSRPWSTVMSWNIYKGQVTYDGIEYEDKGAAFEQIMELPRRSSDSFKVAAGGMRVPIKRLQDCGWDVVDGPANSLTPAQYQDFISSSRGEFSVAKPVYVQMHSGWFSERSACYLATGRPVITQDTGFSRVLPVGEGLFAFHGIEDVLNALETVRLDYEKHCGAARDLAREHFDSDRVLTRLIEDIG